MKMRFKRFLSGFMAVATLASVIVQPVTVSASELEPETTSFERQYPELQDVQDTLDKDEIVEAKDIEIPYGEEFEVEVDLSGIEGVNEKKVKVLFHEAKSEAGTDFDAHTPDTYKAVYAVEPVSGHPAYRVSRNITVKEPETEAQTKSSSENTVGEGNAGETEDSGNAEEDVDSDGSKEIVTDLTDGQEVTTDEESGLTVSEVMDQAENEGIDLYEMEPGETVTFMAAAGNARSSQQVSVTRGAEYRYADYGYGTYLTYQYTVKFGNVSATAYCVQPSKPGPGTGTYTINKVGDGKALAKVCYYGTKASGDDGFFTEENGYGNLSAGARFILVHLAASYANGSSDAFSGANATAQNLAKKLYNYCISQPDIPDVAMSFSDADVTAYVDGNSQRTKEIIFKADELQSITMKLPSGVKLHNVTTGKTSKAGEAVEISGGTKFYLSAPLTQVQDVAGSWSATMKGSVTKDYSAYKISTGSGSQDLALVFGEGVDDEKYVDFKVTWVQHASVKVIKKDAKADAKLSGAVFGLYSDANCTKLITKLPATDANGESSVQIIKTQDTVYLKEITAPTGYRINATAYNVKLEVSKTTTVTVPDADLLKGAGFTAYLVSSLTVKEDGSYDFGSAKPVVIGENGATEIFTDEKGYARSIAIPYGTYIVRETTTPHNYTPVNDFIVQITENHPTTPQVWRVLLDKEFEAKLKIIKQDGETKKAVLQKNTEFKIFNLDTEKYVEQVTTYPTTVKHKSYFTDEQGYLILPQNLKIGHYRIEEVNAPYGYTLNENYYEVDVDSNTAYQMDGTSGDVIIEIAYENHPVKGELNIVKQGEVLNGYKDDFTYQKETLEGAVFEVYAAEDIYTADFQKDDNGNRILEYASGELVGTVTTDKDGKAQIADLPLGTYKIVEKTAPEGFVLNEEAQTVTFEYKDQKTPVIEQTATFENDRQKVEVSVVKQDAETKTVVAGAEFGIYAKEDILAHEEVIVKADTLLGKAVSGEDGKAVFDVDLPFSTYYIKELAAPAGYVSSFETLEVTAKYQGQDVKMVELESVFKNQPTKVTFTKSDITTGVELSGATLTVLDKDGNVVDTWKSVKGEEHLIERLTAGETYTLREEMAPYGYLMAEEVSFTVDDTAEIQKVEMKDAVPTGTLIINKKGEFLEKISALDSIGGWMKHLFEYLSGSLKDVTFEVYALEDIKAADGESEDYYKKDALVATITTDETGVAKLTDLPLGKYCVKEKETANGYVLDGEAREVDLTYRDQNTAVVTYSADWQNKRQRAEVNVLKKEKDSDRVLEGAVFALCNKENIVNAKGDVILKADTVIEEQATDKEGKLTFTADLPLGYTYYVKETSPAPGFATTDQVQEFTFEYGGADKETLSYVFTFEDEPTTVEFTKTSLTDGKEIEGAKLKVTDESGNTVDEWTSGKEPHIIKELTAGKKYTMTETLPADGYVTAESITFTVEDTGEVQKVEMKDDVTKVQISKTDISGKELPGAKLTILDKDGKTVESWTSEKKPHYIEMLPIGEYILREETAPDGYLVAEDVKFTVKDTGEIQKVVMKDEAKPEETPTETPTETPETTPTPETKTTEETKKSTSPKTGDNTPILFWILLAGAGMAGLGGTVILRKKKK